MKTFVIALFCLFTSLVTFGQKGGFTIFAEEGEKFWLVINGQKYNDKPSARVEAKDLNGTRATIKVIFQDTKLGSMDDVVYLKDFDNKIVKATYLVRRKKNRWVLRLSDMEDAITTTTTTTTTSTTTLGTTRTGTQTKETTTKETESPDEEVNISMPGTTIKTDERGNLDIKVTDPINQEEKLTRKEKMQRTEHKEYVITGPKGPGTTAPPVVDRPSGPKTMSDNGYKALLKNIDRQMMEDTKLKVAKVGIKNTMLTTDQLDGIIKEFMMEASKLDFAKTAYKNCSDKDNFLNLTENFMMSTSTAELTEFVQGQ